ncbi:hypothetical protein DYB32_005219 [Aphanomyces invadans]|uniref:UAS domain-containing protein n=1 Tax=Aphanomyces invadans TaxID=157072 RepID=A0A418AV55_9STRA|nr:hypothetical protein DYB32_005219 [Aphanomyces invadans]
MIVGHAIDGLGKHVDEDGSGADLLRWATRLWQPRPLRTRQSCIETAQASLLNWVGAVVEGLVGALNGRQTLLGLTSMKSPLGVYPRAVVKAEDIQRWEVDVSKEEARQLAKQERKWLLVNVQDDTVFASLRLNRDTWNDDFVQNLITSGFVFWQIYISSDHCKKFCSLYQLDQSTLPITCILDPVTGQKVVEWHDYIEPQTMAEKCTAHSTTDVGFMDTVVVSDFACLNSPGAPVARPAEPSPPRSREWTEDDELAAAIAASLEQPSDDGMKSEAAQAAPPPPPAFVPLPDEPVGACVRCAPFFSPRVQWPS